MVDSVHLKLMNTPVEKMRKTAGLGEEKTKASVRV